MVLYLVSVSGVQYESADHKYTRSPKNYNLVIYKRNTTQGSLVAKLRRTNIKSLHSMSLTQLFWRNIIKKKTRYAQKSVRNTFNSIRFLGSNRLRRGCNRPIFRRPKSENCNIGAQDIGIVCDAECCFTLVAI